MNPTSLNNNAVESSALKKNNTNMSIYPIVRYKQKNPVQQRFDNVKGRIMCLAGPPGAGKSKLGKSLATHLEEDGIRVRYFPERVNAAHLNIYLNNKAGEAYAFQDCMITRRLTTYTEAVRYAESGGFAIVDGPITTDNAFELFNYEAGYIDEVHHTVYCEMVKEFGELPAPDFIVYLDCQPKTCIRRLSERGNYAEIVTYDLNYYLTMRRMNTIVVGNTRIATIPFDTDFVKDEKGWLKRENIYPILDDILNRIYENNGIVEQRTNKNNDVNAYSEIEPMYLMRVGEIYVPVKK